MVEAAMIFPIVVAAVMAVLYILIGMFSSLSLQSSIHLALRNECGQSTQTVYRLEEFNEFTYEKDTNSLRSILSIEEKKEYEIKGIFKSKTNRTENGREYLVNEADIIRLRNVVKESEE